MYAKKSDEQGPRRGRSFDSVNSAHEEKQLNNEVSSTDDACVLCFFEKPHVKKENGQFKLIKCNLISVGLVDSFDLQQSQSTVI